MEGRMARKWEYRTTIPRLPQGATSPVMDGDQIQNWLNQEDASGWEFVGMGTRHWLDREMQEWWIFRRPFKAHKR